jgi:hypothetical protein
MILLKGHPGKPLSASSTGKCWCHQVHVQRSGYQCAYRQYLPCSQAGNDPLRLDDRHRVPAAAAAAASTPGFISDRTDSIKEGFTTG